MAISLTKLSRCCQYSRPVFRNFSITMSNMEKVMEDLQKNPYFEKYADRISALQKTSPEEFMQRIEQQQKAKKEEVKKKFAAVDTRQFSSVLNPKEPLQSTSSPDHKRLSDIFKTELVAEKETSEIKTIWEEYHKHKDVISATIPHSVYLTLQQHMTEYPTFLFPLPRSEGYEFIMCQNQGHTVHFTPLLAYQVHKENAPECLTMVHYTELVHKGIVLMRGEYDKNVLTGQEALCLANQFQMYYEGRDKRKLKLLQTFTRSPDTFKHMDLISQLETIGL
ncbi:ATP synthase mitochondrial F1 complex assembly factor 1 [Amyelois transitella]|uniref:ATP synthase mitochondrial F1 complex assembly factor 1 n=1 Tax=Amyelois transitella TaxID=680683 RepID=UPI00298FA5FA|nr:ATP synthase mitochondrial F1 complex assembly factor 1 [Amyelois transitella]